MNCTEAVASIERFAALTDGARAEVHGHVAQCSECRARFDELSGLNEALSALANARSSLDSRMVAKALRDRRGQRVREVVLASIAALLCVLASIWFVDTDIQFARFAVLGMAVALAFQAWRSHRQGVRFVSAADSDAGPGQWMKELLRERRLIRWMGPVVALQFSLLTAFVIWKHELDDPRVAVYIVTALAIAAYVAWQILRRLPELQRELALLETLNAR